MSEAVSQQPTNRIICHFSCGAASAVASKLILSKYPSDQVVIFNAFIREEHSDNRRFLADCERWFGHPVTVLRDEKYGASVHEVWRRKRYVKSHFGAPCSGLLKREVIEAACLPDDTHVFGFTVEEKDRAQRFRGAICPLIDANLTHADCLGIIERAGLILPEMYRLGFNNANCIGCCKGGEGYWNKVRAVFPEQFEQVVQIQESIGPGAYLFRDRKTQVRFGLKDLDPSAGRHNEELPSCSFFCEIAEEDFATPSGPAVPGDSVPEVPACFGDPGQVGNPVITEEIVSLPDSLESEVHIDKSQPAIVAALRAIGGVHA